MPYYMLLKAMMHQCEPNHNKLLIQVPSGEVLAFGDDNFVNFEEVGVKEVRNAAFVLVAGGLGERLGYRGIKVVQSTWIFLIIPLI